MSILRRCEWLSLRSNLVDHGRRHEARFLRPGAAGGAIWLTLVVFFIPLPSFSRPQILDAFDDLTGWHGVTSHGKASQVALRPDAGRQGNCMLMEYSFLGHMGSAAAEKKFPLTLPANFQISFDVRGEGPANNFVIRFMDSLDNVWWVNRSNFVFPREWTRMTIRKSQIQYGWGPSGGGEPVRLDRIMLMVDVVEGGSGKIWIDNLALEPLREKGNTPARVSASSSERGRGPVTNGDGTVVTGWRSGASRGKEWLRLDFGYVKDIGGMTIAWEKGGGPGAFDVAVSREGRIWRRAYRAAACAPEKNYVCLGDCSARYLRLDLVKKGTPAHIGIGRVDIKGPESGFSMNDFSRGVAAESPRGYYPEYLYGEQSYWTVVGAPGDSRKALMNEQGMIEPDMLTCSLEPFLYAGGRLVTWNDVRLTQSLDDEYLPVPSVRWDTRDSLSLTTTAFGAGEPGASSLLLRYSVDNRSAERQSGVVFLAIRPFQVNPPWQTFTIVGGTVRIDSIAFDGDVHVNGLNVVPLTHPSGVGAVEWDGGPVTDYLGSGRLPPAQKVTDHFGMASGALRFGFDIPPGGSDQIVIAVPYHGSRSPLPDRSAPGFSAPEWFERMRSRTAAGWRSVLGVVDISLPGDARAIVRAVRTNLAYILMTADGPALQPGARSYRRSWVRDGSLTSAALLQMGIEAPVRRYIDWYSSYQYPDGSIPAVVESRGPEPTPEHDSHGEYLYMVREYFSFSHDTAWLAGKWDNISRTFQYIQSLRRLRTTDVYLHGTPRERACFGLVPESISHEGYCPAPMHSYWDDFFVLRGLKDAAYAARVLGKSDRAAIVAERDDFSNDILASLRQAIRNTHVRYIPGCAELGDFSGLSTTVAVTPCDALRQMPEAETRYTFDESYRMFLERKNNTAAWDSYLPYEARFVGAYVLLNEKERAADVLEYLMRDRRPAAWNEWAEVVWKNPRAPKSIGDMPHAWAASDFIRSFRTMLAYERDADSSLEICAGIPDDWVRDPQGVSVRGLPTHFGPLSYSVRTEGNRVVVAIGEGTAIPPGGIRVRSPLSAAPHAIGGATAAPDDPRDAVVDRLPARVVFTY